MSFWILSLIFLYILRVLFCVSLSGDSSVFCFVLFLLLLVFHHVVLFPYLFNYFLLTAEYYVWKILEIIWGLGWFFSPSIKRLFFALGRHLGTSVIEINLYNFRNRNYSKIDFFPFEDQFASRSPFFLEYSFLIHIQGLLFVKIVWIYSSCSFLGCYRQRLFKYSIIVWTGNQYFVLTWARQS